MTHAAKPPPRVTIAESGSNPNGSTTSRTSEYLSRVHDRRGELRTSLGKLLSEIQTITWEIGCGHGHYLTAYSSAHPLEMCIGVDIARDRIARATRKRNRAKLSQLHFMVANARDFLDTLPPQIELARIFVLFPDPWPKRRHHKNRLLEPKFLKDLAERSGKGTRLYFRTDYKPYFSEVSSMLSSDLKWEVIDEPWPFELETVFQSRASSYHSLTAALKAAS